MCASADPFYKCSSGIRRCQSSPPVADVRNGSRAVKLLMRICSPDCPRQQTLAWRAEREIPPAAPVEPPSNFKSPCKPGPCGPIPRISCWRRRPRRRRLQPAAAAATTRHLFRPSACHLPDDVRRRFRSSGWLSHHADGRSSAPKHVPFWQLATGDPSVGLLSQADLTEGKAPLPLHLTQASQATGNPETSARSIVCRAMGFRREGLIQTAVMGSWIVRKGRSAEAGWLFAVEAG